jgi:hypothetical protein
VVLSLSHPNTPVFEWWFGNTFVVIDATVGAIVASRRPENPAGWLLCLSGVAVGASTFISQYAIYAQIGREILRELQPLRRELIAEFRSILYPAPLSVFDRRRGHRATEPER